MAPNSIWHLLPPARAHAAGGKRQKRKIDPTASPASLLVLAVGANGGAATKVVHSPNFTESSAGQLHPVHAGNDPLENGLDAAPQTALAWSPSDNNSTPNPCRPSALLSCIDLNTAFNALSLDDGETTLCVVMRNSGGEGLLPDDELLELREVTNS